MGALRDICGDPDDKLDRATEACRRMAAERDRERARRESFERAVDGLTAEIDALRVRAERAERERDAITEACLTRFKNDRWGVFVGNYAVGTFDTRSEAIQGMLDFATRATH